MTDYRKLLLEACDLLDEYVTPSADRYCGRDSLRVDEIRSIASSEPDEPTDEEVREMAAALHAAYWRIDTGSEVGPWNAVAREAWRLGARTMDRTGRPAPGTGGTTP